MYRDLNPTSIFIEPIKDEYERVIDINVKIFDFGLSTNVLGQDNQTTP